MYTLTTQHIKVSVFPEPFLPETKPHLHQFAFTYTILIENLGEETVQLLSRHWIIMSAGIRNSEVSGAGVVGEQPILQPGQSFEYTSGAIIPDPIGTMEGEYTFVTSKGVSFEVRIPKFDLLHTVTFH